MNKTSDESFQKIQFDNYVGQETLPDLQISNYLTAIVKTPLKQGFALNQNFILN